ncbi:MAG TPA: phage tail protein [Bryobacteraceae bacterium]|jgi:phage tail-like protein|nr:phage tail protein [Bryobacteraceae bacterium]
MIPERNNYWLLDSVAGWQIAADSTTGVVYTATEGDITLDPLPGGAALLSNALVNGIECPVALAGNKNGNVFVLDGASDRVSRLDLQAQRARRIHAFGGRGSKLREFKSPRSLTVLPSGSIAVADTGNGRVQLFSAAPHALLQVWAGMKPCAVASDHCGIVYILDRKTRSILRVRASGDWLEPMGTGVLTDPVELAVAADQTIAVVDGRGSNAAIVIFPPDGGKPIKLTLVQLPLCLAFDDTGNLYCGTGNALISKVQPDDTVPDGWSLGGDGVSDLDGSVVKVAWIDGQGLYAILASATAGTAPVLFSMNPAGAYSPTGTFVTQSLESNIETCSWHRVQVVGTVPAGTSVTIQSSTSEAYDSGFSPFQMCMQATGDNPDCLVQSPPGRYLQLQFTLTSNGTATPQIHALKVYFPRQSYLQYLPAVFQDDNQSRLFLDRFLSVFQTTFDNFDTFLDDLWQLFDPYLTPDNVFPWLAAWLALPLDPSLTDAKKRQLLKTAFQYYQIRGTPAGLQQVVQSYTGVTNVRILEHWKLRNWTSLPLTGGLSQGARLWSHNLYARLQLGVSSQVGSFKLTNAPQPASEPDDWGANQFSLMFPANPYTAAATVASVEKIVEREKPAYTQEFLCPIYPRLRVGVQATLGVDAYVGKTNSVVLGKLATLSYDAVLGPSQADKDRQALGLSPYPRLGVDAKIL